MRVLGASIAGFLTLLAAPIYAQDGSALPSETNPPTASATVVEETRPPIIPTASFAAQNNYRSAKLSPDGALVAIRMDLQGEPNILLFDANTLKPVKRGGLGTKVDLEWFRWAGNDKILISISKSDIFDREEALYTRLLLFNTVTGEVDRIGNKEPILKGDRVIHVAPDGSYLLLTLQATRYDYPAVYRFDLNKPGRGKQVEKSRKGIWDYFADSSGVVRVGTGWNNNRMRVYYRGNAKKKMELIGKFKDEDYESDLWDVAYINPDTDMGYVLERGDHGRLELQSFDFARREKVESIYSHPEWDLDVAFVGEDGSPQSAYYTDDRERVVWFHEDDRKLQADLDGALKEEDVRIISRAKDGSKMLVLAGGEADPGALYVYKPEELTLELFGELRPQISMADLTKPKPVEYTARDGTPIAAYLTVPRGRQARDLPLILMPHGGPYGVRDSLVYDDEVQLLANRGYAVLQPNYRGSDGYGYKFSRLGNGQIGRKMQDDIDDAMDWAVAEGIADPERVCVVGGSYGGYAALWAVIRNPERYRCAASWAGVTDWEGQLKYSKDFFTRSGNKNWRQRVEGNVEGFELDSVSPYRQAASLTRPVLLAHGTDDNTVPFKQFKRMRDATKGASVPIELLVIKDEGHSFTKPENEKKWYDTLIAFLAEHNPAD